MMGTWTLQTLTNASKLRHRDFNVCDMVFCWLHVRLKDDDHRPLTVLVVQSNTLFITNQNQRSEPPEQIVRDIVAGFPDDILDRNASKPWKGGFLQDACRVSPTIRPFLFEGQNW